MWGRLGTCAMLVGCTFRPNPGAPGAGDASPGTDGTAVHDGAATGTDAARAIDAPPDTAVTALPCPSSYDLHDSARPQSHYRLVTASATWASAETACENDTASDTLPGHLIVLDDPAEAQWAWDTSNTQQWVGETDIDLENAFLAVTDQTFPYVGIATGNSQTKDCATVTQMSSLTTVVIDTCTGGHPYLCECDGRAANPLNF